MGSSSVLVISLVFVAVIAVVFAIPAVHLSDDDSGEIHGIRMNCYGGHSGTPLLCRDADDDDDDDSGEEAAAPVIPTRSLQKEEDCKPYQDYIKELFICKNRTLTY